MKRAEAKQTKKSKTMWCRIGCLVLCAALLCTGCGRGGDKEQTTTTVPTTTTIPTTTTTRVPTTTQKAEAATDILVNCPDGKAADAELIARISGLCRQQGTNISLYYKDLKTGYTVEYRADADYQTASVIKAPYVKYLLASGADRTEKLKSNSKQGGSGKVDDSPLGTEFTVGELMEYAIRYSDNTAYYMLNERFGFEGFMQYAQSIGVELSLKLTFPRPRFGYLSARHAGLYFEDIAKYIETGSEEALLLKSWLTGTEETRQLPAAFPQYTVAHKYGEQGNQAYHDAAIVYAKQPYVLTILSTLPPYTEESIETFHELARLVDALQAAFYAQ